MWYCVQRSKRVRIRTKIVAIVLPLLVAGLVIGGISASSLARNSITRVIVRFMNFKTDQLAQYMDSQWRILVENEMTSRQDMVQAAQAGVEAYARSLLLSDTELVFALDAKGNVVMATGKVSPSEEEKRALMATALPGDRTLVRLPSKAYRESRAGLCSSPSVGPFSRRSPARFFTATWPASPTRPFS